MIIRRIFRWNALRRYNRQLIAIIEKEIYLEMRVKARIVIRFLNPMIQLIVLIFIFGLIFRVNEGYSIGYWNVNNYILFLLLAFIIQFSKSIIFKFNSMVMKEKYWKTLSAIMVAPTHRFTLLFGILLSELLLNCIAFIILFIIALILFPISLFFIFLALVVLFLIFITFGSIGLLISAFGMSKEDFVPYINVILRMIFLFSCINYPKEIFPETFQNIVVLNPFYYFFDLLRIVWYLGIDYDSAILLISPIHIICVILFSILTPIISIYIFNRMYTKYGIAGY